MEVGGYTTKYPGKALSNFSPYPFVIDGIECNSMEGFLQSLKFKSPKMQEVVCQLVGKAAKFKGKNKKWWKTQTLWWKGIEFDRHSSAYQKLLDRAFNALAENTKFKKALLASNKAVLTHSIGKKDAHILWLFLTIFSLAVILKYPEAMDEVKYNIANVFFSFLGVSLVIWGGILDNGFTLPSTIIIGLYIFNSIIHTVLHGSPMYWLRKLKWFAIIPSQIMWASLLYWAGFFDVIIAGIY